ncbi:glycosyltransferase involved in cell wall biosynthesis [Sphingobium sp. B1D7B]|uniref:glycosyltransferase family 4 protein n=1 Tax=unclassified Sphingobium TaxID=2611147 RepID=UPI002224532F|nr:MULTISPECIES: glycosyltransferase family 4 protein [unclassified Sphingobium]MCW2391902.1 glycosyltransferase involved in cell wall biosynthesis [Sphingobium sp. B11D3A]MCW2403658.1 glycosyltransferase involved in cell wall biosynthesis [Sphingobium sp. B1D7B]
MVITTPAWAHGDGVGHDIDGMARSLLSAGCKVIVHAQHYSPVFESWRVDRSYVRDLLEEPATVLIHHHSIGCEENETLLRSARSRIRIMRYHNVTPPEFFEGYSDDWVRSCEGGRRITPDLVRYCTDFSVPSLYDARDLVHAGAPVDRITYCPYFHKLEDFDRVTPTSSVLDRLRQDERFHVLFLGRRVNNKGHLHLIRTIAAYVREYDNRIVLHLVGSSDQNLKRYDDEIRAEISAHALEQNVILYDKLPFADIVAFYKGCDAFLCMSEHEGFCIPVIEAEYCGLPVLAHYRRGVPEALGPTQPWFTSLNYADYARVLRRIRVEPGYARSLGEAGAASVRERFDIAAIQARFLEWTEDLVLADRKGAAALPMAAPSPRRKIAFIVQRFGRDVAGGAEAFARMYAERLAEFFDITVLTTTSKTLDWDSDLAVGSQKDIEKFEILRFPPHHRRNLEQWDAASAQAFAGEISYEEWQFYHGPHVPELRDYLDHYAEDFDLIVNWTYMFATSTYAPKVRGRVPLVNVPFFHDEMWLYMQGCGANALQYDANIYQTQAEKDLAARAILGIDRKNSIVLGAGVQEAVLDEIRSANTCSPLADPYIVYVGRIEKPKGIPDLLEQFRKYKEQSGSSVKLVIIGRPHGMEIEADDDIILPGFVSEEEKATYIKHALCLINPSHFESFSLVLVESWSLGRPVMVTGACAATTGQVERSGGGFVYRNYREFAWSLDTLEKDKDLGDRLGANGSAFYETNYRWSRLVPKLRSFFDSVIAG